MLGKLVVHGPDRTLALARAREALGDLVLLGVTTNVSYLRRLLADPDVAAGRMHTGLIAEKPELAAESPLDPGTLEALIAAAALSLPDVRAAVDAIPDLQAAMGGWRN